MKQADIWTENGIVKTIFYTSFTSEAIEQAYFFMEDDKNVAIIPWRFLIIFIN